MPVPSSTVPPLRSPWEDLPPEQREIAISPYRAPHFNQDREGLPNRGFDVRKYYVTARLTPRLKMAIRTQVDAVFWVPYSVQANPGNDYVRNPEYKFRDDYLIKLITRMFETIVHDYSDFRHTFRAFLWNAMVCGYAVAEKIWAPVDGIWRLVAIKNRAPWLFTPWLDEWGNLLALYYQPTGEYLHPNYFVYAPWPDLGCENYAGVSEVEPLMQDLALLEANKKALNQIIHKVAIQPLQHIYDVGSANTPENQKAMRAAENLEACSVIHTPALADVDGALHPQHEFKAFEDRTSQPLISSLEKVIAEDERLITRTIGIPDQLGVTTTTAGSWAQARTQFDFATARYEEGQRWLEAVWNRQLIKDILHYNYPGWLADPGYLPPCVKFQPIDEESQAKRELHTAEMVAKGLYTPSEGRQLLGKPALPVDRPNISYEDIAAAKAQLLHPNEIREKYGYPHLSDDEFKTMALILAPPTEPAAPEPGAQPSNV